MEVEKRRSKGGFLHLFDWNGKSRKKLFPNNPELDDKSKKGKENVGNMAKSLLHVIDADESRGSSSNKGSFSDFNCASSVTSDESHGTRAPGVVARLMGLDSIPTSSASEPTSTPYFNYYSHGPFLYDRNASSIMWSENANVDCHNIHGKEWFSSNHFEASSMVRKVPGRPIERFQTESLPPKSAKSIPITHHKLLSPIKSPGFVPTKNTAYIVEASAKIIEASPRDRTKDRRPSIASSVPLRIWDLREKLEAADRASRPQKSNERVSARYTKVHSNDQRNSESCNKPVVRSSVNVEKRSCDIIRKKGKSVSLAEQAKSSVQRRDGPTSSSSNRSSMKQKEKSDVKTGQLYRNEADTQRPVQKRTSLNKSNNALKPNNHKQNYASTKDSSSSKNSVSKQQGEKAKSLKNSVASNRSANKVVANSSEIGLRKTGLSRIGTGKQVSSSKSKISSQKKQSVNEDSPSEKSVSDNELIKKEERRSITCNVAVDGCANWGAVDRSRGGADVVSFTFSSPIRSSKRDSQLSDQVSNGSNQEYYENSEFPSPGVNVIGGDDLSALLERKLRELTTKVDSSQCNVIKEGSTNSDGLRESVPTLGAKCREDDKELLSYHDKNVSDNLDSSCCKPAGGLGLCISKKCQLQHSEETGKHSNSSTSCEIESGFNCQDSYLSSSFEPSLMSFGCSDSGNSINDSDGFATTQGQLPSDSFSGNLSSLIDVETELLDSASSSSILFGDIGKDFRTRTSSSAAPEESGDWELDYVREILENADLAVKEFALGEKANVISPYLFKRLENNKMERNKEEFSKLLRKVLFDCVCESMDFRCQQLFVGSGNKVWARGVIMFERKERLAEELYKEIVSWKSMEELMVDEVIDTDMSSKHGKWVDFEFEAFEEGLEIGNEILTCLVDELVCDFLIL